MRWRLTLFLVVVVAGIFLLATFASAQSGACVDAINSHLLAQINASRDEVGVAPVTCDENLSQQAAQPWAEHEAGVLGDQLHRSDPELAWAIDGAVSWVWGEGAENLARRSYAVPVTDGIDEDALSDINRKWLESATHGREQRNSLYTHIGLAHAFGQDGKIYVVAVYVQQLDVGVAGPVASGSAEPVQTGAMEILDSGLRIVTPVMVGTAMPADQRPIYDACLRKARALEDARISGQFELWLEHDLDYYWGWSLDDLDYPFNTPTGACIDDDRGLGIGHCSLLWYADAQQGIYQGRYSDCSESFYTGDTLELFGDVLLPEVDRLPEDLEIEDITFDEYCLLAGVMMLNGLGVGSDDKQAVDLAFREYYFPSAVTQARVSCSVVLGSHCRLVEYEYPTLQIPGDYCPSPTDWHPSSIMGIIVYPPWLLDASPADMTGTLTGVR